MKFVRFSCERWRADGRWLLRSIVWNNGDKPPLAVTRARYDSVCCFAPRYLSGADFHSLSLNFLSISPDTRQPGHPILAVLSAVAECVQCAPTPASPFPQTTNTSESSYWRRLIRPNDVWTSPLVIDSVIIIIIIIIETAVEYSASVSFIEHWLKFDKNSQ